MEERKSFWRELSKKKSFWISLTVAAAVAVVVGLGWVIYDASENARLDAESVVLKEDLTVAFGEGVKVSDFLASLQGELMDDREIDTEKLGEQVVSFEYINIRNRRRKAEFAIQVIDVTAPRVYGGSRYTVNLGYKGDLTDLMMSGDDLDDSPRREIVGEYDVDKVGRYAVEYVVTDASGNETRQPFTLNVVKPTGSGNATPVETPKLEIAEVIAEHKAAKTKIGIDVSQWQGEIDWKAVKEAGVEFAMIRVGYQKGYGGEYVLDPYFVDNMLGATEVAGLPVGVYFYSYATSVEEAQEQAKWVAAQISGFGVKLGVAFDWEDWGNFNKAGMSFRTINRVAEAFLEAINEYGSQAYAPYGGMLYGSKVYLERIWETDQLNYPVWLAQYYDKVTYGGDYMIWQMSCVGKVDGIYGDVDVNILYEK